MMDCVDSRGLTHAQLRPKPIVLHVNRQLQREAAFSSTVFGPESYPCDGMMPVGMILM